MDGLRRFLMVDNYEAVKVGDLEGDHGVPIFTTDFPGADELTLRAEEEGMLRTFIDTTDVGDNYWKPPLVDEDWHAICQAIFQSVEGPEWETMYYNNKDSTTRSNARNLEKTRRPRAFEMKQVASFP